MIHRYERVGRRGGARAVLRSLAVAALILSVAASAPPAAAATCGDGIVEGGEECDPGGARTIGAVAGGTACTSGGTCFFVGSGGCCKFNCQAVGSGLECSDGNACSIGEHCNQVGQCECAGGCDPLAGVGSVCRASSGECDPAEICQAGTGCPSDSKSPSGTACTDDGVTCTADQCNGNSALCQHPAGNAGVTCRASAGECDPPETCTGNSATCPAQQPPTGTPCTDDGNVCTNDVCDSNSACTHPNNTASCDDGLFCNGNDTCSGGSCATHGGDPCPSGGECNNGTCDEEANNCAVTAGTVCSSDGNVCTDDVCNGAGSCGHVNNTSPCNDNLFCNGSDTCSGGSCSVHGTNPCAGGAECNNVCNEGADNCLVAAGIGCTDDGNVCTNDTCNGVGACAHPNNAAPCDDGLFCTGVDTCSAGACGHTGDPCLSGSECADTCNETANNCLDLAGSACTADSNVCTNDVCNGSGACTHPNNTAPCDDGLFCNVNEVCSGGSCGGGTARDCSDPLSDICTTDACDENANTCVNSPNPGANGSACNDHDACTTATTCSNGACAGGAPTNCDDGTYCTSDSCVPATGCINLTDVENRECNSCFDDYDNDGDGNLDFEDSGCSTLWREQRVALGSSSSLNKRSKRLFAGADAHVDSIAGTEVGAEATTPYPRGRSRAGICGHNMKILAGVTAGFLATEKVLADQKGIECGSGEVGERFIQIREAFASNGGPEVLHAEAPIVGPGQCSDDANACTQDTALCASSGNLCCSGPGALCGGFQTLTDPGNPNVDRTGLADNFLRCQAALAGQAQDSLGVATLAGNVPGYTLADAANIKVGKNNTGFTLTFGGGLNVLEVNKVVLSGTSELVLLGQDDTVVVVRVKKKLGSGGGGRVTLGSNGLGLGSLRADHLLWNVEGTKGGKVSLKRASIFKGTILAPNRACVIGGAADFEGAAFCQSIFNAATRVLHAPFTPCLADIPQQDCGLE